MLAVLSDKDLRGICQALAPIADSVILPKIRSERAAAPTELAKTFSSITPSLPYSITPNIGEALTLAGRKPSAILITGSLHFAGEVIAHLRGEPAVEKAVEDSLSGCIDAITEAVTADAGLDAERARLLAVGLVGRGFGAWRRDSDGWKLVAQFGRLANESGGAPYVASLTSTSDGFVCSVSDGANYELWRSDNGTEWEELDSPIAPETGGGRTLAVAGSDEARMVVLPLAVGLRSAAQEDAQGVVR